METLRRLLPTAGCPGAQTEDGRFSKAHINWSGEVRYRPALAVRAKTEGAESQWADETGLTNRGKLRFMVYAGALNAALFPRFLRRLVKGARCKLFLIVDNLRVHRARVVTAWIEAHRELTWRRLRNRPMKAVFRKSSPISPTHQAMVCVQGEWSVEAGDTPTSKKRKGHLMRLR